MSLRPLNSPGGFSVGESTTGVINVISSTGNVTTGNIIGSDGGNLNIIADNLLINGGNGVGNLTVGNLLATGNVQGSFLLGNIRFATGGYDDANVEAYLPTYTGGFENLTGDVTTTANVTGQYILGNGYFLSNINASNIVGSYSNADVANYLASNANVTILTTGNISSSANISGQYILGNGTFLTGMYSNADVKNFLQSGNTINANFDGGTLYAMGAANLGPTQVNGNLVVAGNISATGNITYISVQDLVIDDPLIYLGANNPGNTEDLGLVASYNDGTYQHTGFVRDYTDGTWKVFQGVTSEPNTVIAWNEAVMAPFKAGPILSNASITANANVVATGNVSGSYLLGNGYFITGIQYSNINGAYGNSNVANYLPTYTGNLVSLTGDVITTANISAAYVAGTLTTAAQPNITSLGTLNSLVVGATVLADGYSARTGSDLPITVLGANANILIAPNGTGITDFANKPIANISSATISGNVTASGNVSGTYLLGNGAFITGLPAGYSNANVANYLPTYTGNLGAGNLNLTGNIIDTGPLQIITGSGNIGLAPSNSNVLVVSTTGIDVTGAITATGNITTTGNLVAGNYLGSGANTTIAAGSYNWNFNDSGNLVLPSNSFSINYANGTQVALGGSYSNSTVANYLASNANITILTTGNITSSGNISGSYLLGNGAFITGLSPGYSNADVANYLNSAANISILLGNSNSNITTGGTIRTYGDSIANNFVANATVTIQSSAGQAVVFDAINQTTSSATLTTLATIDVTTLPADTSALEVTLRGKDGTNTQAGKIMIAWGGSNMDYTRYAEVLAGAGCGVPSVSFDGTNLLIQVTPLNGNSMSWNGSITSV